MSEEPSQAWSPSEEASPVPPSEPASSNADVHRRAEVEAESVRLPGLTERQEQLRRNPAAFTPGEDYGADRVLGTTVPAAETTVPTRNERPTMVTGQGGSVERCPEQQRDPAAPTTPPTALPPELASQSSLERETRAVEEQTKDPGEIALDATVGGSAFEDRLKRLEVRVRGQGIELGGVQADLQDHKRKNLEDQAAAKQSQEKLQREVETLKKDVERLTREKEEFRQQLEKLTKELEQERREKEELKQEKTELESRLEEQGRQHAEREEELERDKNELERKLLEKTKQLEDKEKELQRKEESTQKSLEEKERTCRQLKADNEVLKAELDDQSSLNYQQCEAMKEIHRMSAASLGTLEQDAQAYSPPPPYDDRMAPAAPSVEAEASVLTDGPGQAPSVQGPVFHGQPPVGNRLPNPTGAPESDQSSDDQEESPSNQTGNRRPHESDRENFFDGDLC